MKLFSSVIVKQITGRRNYCVRRYPYVPWRNLEVIQSIEDELKEPPRQVIPENPVKRVSATNPADHTYADVGKFYTLPPADIKRYFQLGGIPKPFTELSKAFNETCLMIRKPFLEVRDYLIQANYSNLPNKYVLYGPVGSGKSLTLLHILHYAALQEFVILHLPNPNYWFKWGKKEAHRSETRPGLIDLPIEAALVLKHFQLQNSKLLEKLELTTSKTHEWNIRESTPAGSPIMDIVAHGINRVKYACDCFDILIDELKVSATNNKCKVLCAIDGYNSLYTNKTMIRIDEKYGTKPEEVSLVQSVFKITKPDWCNGAIVAAISEKTTTPDNRGSFLPFFLLQRKGFEDLDPFIPVQVPELSEMEFHSMLDYYEDRRWLQKPGGRDEIEFISSRIPNDIRNYCAPL
ncbi:small ribosomal subunit protein mS29 [Planococcus citri]|uniref:small ribosomal subunit protein mS29 n=1 Tax=Planococcus citri TaxID=170843 RepID=UPI0031F8E8E1